MTALVRRGIRLLVDDEIHEPVDLLRPQAPHEGPKVGSLCGRAGTDVTLHRRIILGATRPCHRLEVNGR